MGFRETNAIYFFYKRIDIADTHKTKKKKQ